VGQNFDGDPINILSCNDTRLRLCATYDYNNTLIYPLTTYCNRLSAVQSIHPPLSINVYPNPSAGNIQVETEDDLSGTQITVTDILGQALLTQSNLTGKSVNLGIPNYKAGIIFLKLESPDGRSYLQKLLIK
jgi:hypothetical protein